MKAVAYLNTCDINQNDALVDIIVTEPKWGANDVLVAGYGIGVKPEDAKIRQRRQPPAGEPAILGWDAAGTILSVGENVFDFKEGDDVWYAGAIDRPGCNAQYQVVDARLVSKKPSKLSFAQ